MQQNDAQGILIQAKREDCVGPAVNSNFAYANGKLSYG